ncbi:hypothetical protein ACFQVD_26420 [Streptosporangium amethystogenes subsp. fukuiense]|uniref:Siphovirus-type tail component C-terminal domain-containing protein n=1 Tax=Streptosporangium amethystogenes subsp. fukuiense TaxID=698418 RepID=A0ABW2T4U0_9ACTN
MARLGRSVPIRPRLIRRLPSIRVSFTLAPFEAEAEFPALTVSTPSARVRLPPFEAEAEFPALAVTNGQRLPLAPFEAEAEFPPLTVTTPVRPGDSITLPGQVEWNYTLWGPGTNFRVLTPVEGWRSMPQVDNLNVPRPSRHGAWAARKLVQQRLVTIRLQLDSASTPEQVDDLLAQLDAVTGIAEDETALPLVIRAYGAPQLAFGQIIDRDVQLDGDYNAGLPGVSILVACDDPRRYNPDRTGVSIPAGDTVQAINAGNTATHPVVRMPGPITDPVLVNAATGRTIAFAATVADGKQLVINTDKGTATVDGDSVMSTLTGSSAPVADWVLAPGANPITYTAASGNASLTLLYRDAWI